MIGAGIVGIATALWLQRDGCAVCIADPGLPAEAGASAGNAGLIATHIVRPIGMPGMWRKVPSMLLDPLGPLALRPAYLPRLTPWLLRILLASRPRRVLEIAAALNTQLSQAWLGLEPLIQAAGATEMVRRDGVYVAHRDAEALAQMKAELDICEALGVPFRRLSGEELRERITPIAGDYRAGIQFPASGHTVEPQQLARALFRAFEAGGGTYRREAVRRIRVDEGRAVAAETADGTLEADAFVVAAGAWSRSLCRDLGLDVPLDTERGYHVTLGNPGVELEAPVLLGDARFAVTPMTPGIRLAGTIEFGGMVAPPNPARFDRMITFARRAFPGIDTSTASRWMGFRPSLPDSLPVIGRSPRHRNAYFAFGHGHLGLTSAGITGKALADLMAGRDPPFDLSPFRIDRFGRRAA